MSNEMPKSSTGRKRTTTEEKPAAVPGVRTWEGSADECECAACEKTLDNCLCEEPLFQL